MKVLLSFVGKRDPHADDGTEGPILTLSRYAGPDIVLMFPTARRLAVEEDPEETESRAEMVRDLLVAELGLHQRHVRLCPIVVEDPRDHEAILKFLRRAIPENLGSLRDKEDCELLVNLSSGTAQMHAAWLVTAVSGLLPRARLYEVSRPRDPGHSGSPNERVSEVDIRFLHEDILIERFRAATRDCLFTIAEQCAGELGRITSDVARAAVAESLRDLMAAYVRMDVLDYGPALRQIRDVLTAVTGKRGLEEVENLARKQEEVLRVLAAQGKECIIGLVDIHYNSLRCYHRGAYADSLARFYRVYEGTLYLRLRQVGIEPLNAPGRPGSGSDTGAIGPPARNSVILHLNKAEQVLVEKDQSVKHVLETQVQIKRADGRVRRDSLCSLLHSLRDARNRSVVGHNMRSVTNDEAWQGVQLGAIVLESLCGEEAARAIRDYPFAKERLQILGEVLVAR